SALLRRIALAGHGQHHLFDLVGNNAAANEPRIVENLADQPLGGPPNEFPRWRVGLVSPILPPHPTPTRKRGSSFPQDSGAQGWSSRAGTSAAAVMRQWDSSLARWVCI